MIHSSHLPSPGLLRLAMRQPGSCKARPGETSSMADSHCRTRSRPLELPALLMSHWRMVRVMAGASWSMSGHSQMSSTRKRKTHVYRGCHLQFPPLVHFLVWWFLQSGRQQPPFLFQRLWRRSHRWVVLGDAGHCATHSLLSTSSWLFWQMPEK